MLDIFKTASANPGARTLSWSVFCAFHASFYFLQARWQSKEKYSLFSIHNCPNPQTLSKPTLSSTPHIVLPTDANLPANSIFPFVNARCADLFKNITQVPGEPWCLPALQIKKIHLLICSVSICLLNWEWLLAVQTDTRAIWLRTTSLCTFPLLIWHNRPGAGRELSRCDRMSGGLPLYVRN